MLIGFLVISIHFLIIIDLICHLLSLFKKHATVEFMLHVVRLLTVLLHDVASGSDIKACFKNDIFSNIYLVYLTNY